MNTLLVGSLLLASCAMPNHPGIATGVNSVLSAVAVTTLLTSTKPDDSGPMVRTGAAVLLTGALFAEVVTWSLYEPSPSR